MLTPPRSRNCWLLAPLVLTMLSACSQPAATNTVTTARTAATTAADASESPKVAREILDAAWMDISFQRELQRIVECQDVGILVPTRGYAPDDEVSLVVGATNDSKEYDTRLYGKVDEDGKARIRWPAMGCVDHMPTPLLQSLKSEPESEVAAENQPSTTTVQTSGKPAPKASDPQTLPEIRPAAPLK